MRAEQILPDHVDQTEIDGVIVRKGTVGAFLRNAKAWTAPHTPEPQRREAERDIVEAVPALRALGLFDAMMLRDDRLRQLVADASPDGA